MKLSPIPNGVSTHITPQVSVTYDRQYNMVEVFEGKRVLACNVTPRGYTLNQFVDYVNKVRRVYETTN